MLQYKTFEAVEQCLPQGSLRHWLQLNSQTHNHVKLNYGVIDMMPIMFIQ